MVHAFKTTRIHYPDTVKNGPLPPETVRAMREKGQGRPCPFSTLAWMINKHRKLLPILENYCDNQEQTMLATLTSRRDHNFRVNNRKAFV